jgi:hypothetical protein
MDAMCAMQDNLACIRAELDYLDLLLRRAVVMARAHRPASDRDAFRGLVISDDTVDTLVDTVTFAGEPRKARDLLADLDRQIASRRLGRVPPPNTAHLATLFGLGEAECDLLLIALAPELETRFETIYAYLQNDVTRKRPSVELALDLICEGFADKVAARHMLEAGAPLRRLRIIELGEETYDRRPTLLRCFLKLDESVIRFLLDQPPSAMAGVRMVSPGAAQDFDLSAETKQTLDVLKGVLRSRGTAHGVVQMLGKDEAPIEQAAITLGTALDRRLLFVTPGRLAEDADAAFALVRDAALWNALPVLVNGDPPEAMAERARLGAAEASFWDAIHEGGLGAIVLGGAENPARFPAGMQVWQIAVTPPDVEGRAAGWRAATQGLIPDADAERLADMFPFGAARMERAVGMVRSRAELREPSAAGVTMADLVQAGRALATPNLQRFAVAVSPRYDWDDLVLPSDRLQQLRTVAARVGNRQIVQREWGFGEKLSRGRGVAVMFSGVPGTGKTMAAEVMANALSLPLFQIDLSTVVSKYIGETEKQLGVIFAEAERSQCILFFDECDAIFGKRTEVKDAHDRYANTEVNYLLQRLEQYDGIVLLATNFQKNIDDAFLRRLHDSIDFPFPDDVAREHIWRKQFPTRAPVDADVDYGFLARQFKLPGGNIRNAALYAAFRAAEEGGRSATIRMEHLLEGVRREFQKQGKLVIADEGVKRGAPM